MNEKKTLVIVDVQRDFYHKDGALYVPGGEKIIPVIKKYMEDNADSIGQILFTQDWHPSTHCSFNINGGPWPVHCVQNSEGAGLPIELILTANELVKNSETTRVEYVQKGQEENKEEYGAFLPIAVIYEKEEVTAYANGRLPLTKDIVVCGLALDFCVLETIKNLLKAAPHIHISLLKDGCSCIGFEEKANEIYEWLRSQNVDII